MVRAHFDDQGIFDSGETVFYSRRDTHKTAFAEMEKLCRERFEQFGTAGKAGKIKATPLRDMAARYKKGELAPTIH